MIFLDISEKLFLNFVGEEHCKLFDLMFFVFFVLMFFHLVEIVVFFVIFATILLVYGGWGGDKARLKFASSATETS